MRPTSKVRVLSPLRSESARREAHPLAIPLFLDLATLSVPPLTVAKDRARERATERYPRRARHDQGARNSRPTTPRRGQLPAHAASAAPFRLLLLAQWQTAPAAAAAAEGCARVVLP